MLHHFVSPSIPIGQVALCHIVTYILPFHQDLKKKPTIY